MKILYKDIARCIKSNPSIEEVSEKLFQLGHENTIEKNSILDIEFTPNRGDCLSLHGIVRDLNVFYKTELKYEIYEDPIKPLSLDFLNKSKKICPKISFLKIVINSDIKNYSDYLESYFKELNLNKNNFFTDVSNYLSYEIGQPTHCYDLSTINNQIIFKEINDKVKFRTLTNKDIVLSGSDAVFCDGEKVINLAGVMGGIDTACSKSTREVLVECAFFEPEAIIGKSTKYDLESDAAYKFERCVDIDSQEHTLRRFLNIVKEHVEIQEVEIFSETYRQHQNKHLDFDSTIINKIVGIDISDNEYRKILLNLGFKVIDKVIEVPSFRNDVATQNDLAEEVARVIGYDHIEPVKFNIKSTNTTKINLEPHIKNLLIDYGFSEVINNPFSPDKDINSISVDNPLDVNRNFLRTNLKKTLIKNLQYNERRQKDSIKLFEISDVYSFDSDFKRTKRLGVIASGRIGKNYLDFSKKISKELLINILKSLNIQDIDIVEEFYDDESKNKNPIIYFEIDVQKIVHKNFQYEPIKEKSYTFNKYSAISEFPSSNRDLSFSVTDFAIVKKLEDMILGYQNKFLKEVFVFDYFYNKKNNEIKIGFRFIFQASDKTLKDKEITQAIDKIINKALKLNGVSIPGLNK